MIMKFKKYNKIILMIMAGASLILFYLNIFWLEWILLFVLFILLGNKFLQLCLSKTKHNYKILLFFIELLLLIYLFFPLHLLFVWNSVSATQELAQDAFSGQLSCNTEKMYCTNAYEECDYKNTRNCVCKKCFPGLSFDNCSECFIHDKQAFCSETDNTCYLAW